MKKNIETLTTSPQSMNLQLFGGLDDIAGNIGPSSDPGVVDNTDDGNLDDQADVDYDGDYGDGDNDVDTQPQQSNQQDGQPGTQQQRMYANKYKSPEELENAYANMNREATRMAQELAQYRQYMQQIQQQQQQTQQPNKPNPQHVLMDFANDPVGTMQKIIEQSMQQHIKPIEQTIQNERFDRTIERMSSDQKNYPLFNELKGDIANALESNPWLFNSHNPIEAAYNMVRGQNMDKFIQQAINQSKQIDQQNQQQYINSQVTSGSRGKPPRVGAGNATPQNQILQGILAVRNPVDDFINS